MSISAKITTIQQQVAAAHSAITNKGGTGSAGTQNLVSAINSIPVGGGPGLETPDVYLKVEKLFTMTPAGKKGVYLNGKWDRDLEWLAPADVPMTFSGGSFGWSGTRALARYKKSIVVRRTISTFIT